MAISTTKSTVLLPLTFLLLLILLTTTTALGGGKLGGRTQIHDVKNNKEIQDLGKYCVQQHNRNNKNNNNNNKLLIFTEVVKAESQIVSGTKYYLTISTRGGAGADKMSSYYDAVVLVKPWMKNSKQLLGFDPSPKFQLHQV